MTLTAITQANVDNGHGLREALLLYNQWLKENGLSSPCINNDSKNSSSSSNADMLSLESPSFCIITWGDSDLGTILKEQCKRLDIEIPIHFHQWINLKALFKQHFGWEPHGGLQHVVERLGFVFEGRAHSGLVDSKNTAKIVKKMLEEGYKFTRATRNIHAYKDKPQ
jgi:ERI1 exoribonuclease 2